MEELSTSDLDGEEQYEAEAAFGEDADLIRLEEDDLEPVETPDYMLKNVLEEDDWVTVRHKAGNVTTGPIEEVENISFTLDPRNRTTCGYFSFGDFICEDTDDRGVVNELIDVNGEPAARVIENRLGDA